MGVVVGERLQRGLRGVHRRGAANGAPASTSARHGEPASTSGVTRYTATAYSRSKTGSSTTPTRATTAAPTCCTAPGQLLDRAPQGRGDKFEQVALSVRRRLEEVEHVAAAAEARPVAGGGAGQHGCAFGPPGGAEVETELYADRVAADRVVRDNLNRQVGHRRDRERIDSAHRLHLAGAVDQDAVTALLG